MRKVTGRNGLPRRLFLTAGVVRLGLEGAVLPASRAIPEKADRGFEG
jgi:hypothetical protein